MVWPKVHSSPQDRPAEARPSDLCIRQRGSLLTVYLDASALVKAFLFEEGSDTVRQVAAEPVVSATSRISYAECHAAFARAQREGRLGAEESAALVQRFNERWPDLAVVEVDAGLAERAGRLTQEHPLRAGDAIHLASAESLVAAIPSDVRVASWDRRLWEAYAKAGFTMIPASLTS